MKKQKAKKTGAYLEFRTKLEAKRHAVKLRMKGFNPSVRKGRGRSKGQYKVQW